MLPKNIFKGGFGLERETLRVDENGRLAQTPHPFTSERFVRDFCEFQLELITPVCNDTEHLMETLSTLDKEARNTLKENNEYLWMYSNPPHFENEDDITIAKYCGDELAKHEYRVYLGNKYGKRIMLYSGIHLNFSLSEELLKELHTTNESFSDFKNNLYFRLSKQAFRYSWLPVLLTAASPIYDISLKQDYAEGIEFDNQASLRNGKNGYWNDFIPILDYSDLESHINSINRYIADGKLFSAAELYLPVRLKPAGSNCLERLTENGVSHIELRLFDINPLAPLGIFKEDLDFAHYLLIYLMHMPDFDFTPELQKTATNNHKSAAKYYLEDIKINNQNAVDAGTKILYDMLEYFKGYPKPEEIIKLQLDKLLNNNRYCVKIYNQYKSDYKNPMH